MVIGFGFRKWSKCCAPSGMNRWRSRGWSSCAQASTGCFNNAGPQVQACRRVLAAQNAAESWRPKVLVDTASGFAPLSSRLAIVLFMGLIAAVVSIASYAQQHDHGEHHNGSQISTDDVAIFCPTMKTGQLCTHESTTRSLGVASMLLSLNQSGKIAEIPSTLLDGVIFVVKIARFHLRISSKIEGGGLIRLPQWSTGFTICQWAEGPVTAVREAQAR